MSVVFGVEATMNIFIPIDMCVSLLCVYLQNGFANAQYAKYCVCLNGCTGKCIEKRMKQKMETFKRASLHEKVSSPSNLPSTNLRVNVPSQSVVASPSCLSVRSDTVTQ